MNHIFLVAGITIVITTVIDLFYTTFSPDGAGYFANIITRSSYNSFRLASRITDAPRLFEAAGVVTIVLILIFWYLSIWLGSSLIFCWSPNSVINSQTQASVSIIEKFYYAGFTISTLGVGDYVAGSDFWRVVTVLMSFLGFVLLTTGISYMLPVLSATVNKRRLGSHIALLGETPQDIIKRHWQGDKFVHLESHFNNLADMITQHTQQLLAYPVVYSFYSLNPRKSAALNIAKMDEVLTILLLHIPVEVRPDEQSIYPLRQAIVDYLLTQRKYFIESKAMAIGYPKLDELKEAGIPLLHPQDNIAEVWSRLDQRRELLAAILAEQNRSFSDIYGERFEHKLEL